MIFEPLPEDEGGGFAALVPDLPGCMSDGETPEAALASVQDAAAAWIEEATYRKVYRPGATIGIEDGDELWGIDLGRAL